jgi:S-formylglutathione hydrolase FrmB
MKAKTTCLFLAIFLLASSARAQGTMVDDYFISTALGEERLVQVYLPEGYNDPGNTDHYPMIMFLHGDCSYPSEYSASVVPQLDSLISTGWINPTIVVFPDATTETFSWLIFPGGSWYTNSELYGDYEDFIVQDVITHIDATYRTLAISDWRCIMGHSMGGFGSMKLAVTHPSLFKGVAAHAGPLNYEMWLDTQVPLILAENAGPPYNWTPYVLSSTLITFITFHEAGAFSPNLNNPPYYVDFPLDESGALIDTVFDRWLEHNPAALVEGLEPGELEIYFDCGTADGYLLHVWNESFADTLEALGLDYTFLSHSGVHSVPERYPISLTWLDSIMQSISIEPYEITLTPENPPIQISASGGSFNFNIAAANNTDSSATCDVWCNITLPNGSIYGPVLGPVNLTLNAGFSGNRNRTQNVPGIAPSGEYSYVGYIGVYPDIVWNMDSFPFEKLATGDGVPVNSWANNGDDIEAWLTEPVFDVPANFALLGAHPNPFNPTTTIGFALSEAARVQLTVYDMQGRKVAEVVNGYRDAGHHEVTFDGANLASGVYVYRLRAGDFSANGKMVLMR